MARPVAIFTGQRAGLGLKEMCRTAKDMGYDGLEIASWSQIDLQKAMEDPGYIKNLKDTLEKYGPRRWAVGVRLPGRYVDDAWDPRLDGFVPPELVGKPEEIRAWGIQQLKYAVMAAKAMGVEVVTGFMSSPIWKMWYSLPQTTEEMVEEGFRRIKELQAPIFGVSGQYGVKSTLEVHLTEIVFDYYSTQKLLEMFEYRETLGTSFNPSHLIWQGMDPTMFLYDFASRVYYVHIKDAVVNLSGGNGILGSHITFEDPGRGWNFISSSHEDVDFNKIIRILNVEGYEGPLSIEWEDSGMDRILGGTEACAFTKKIDFLPSDIASNGALKTK